MVIRCGRSLLLRRQQQATINSNSILGLHSRSLSSKRLAFTSCNSSGIGSLFHSSTDTGFAKKHSTPLLPNSTNRYHSNMKLHLAPFLAAAATVSFPSMGSNAVVTAFQVSSLSSRNGRSAAAFVGIQHTPNKRHLSSTARQMAESLTEYDTTTTAVQQQQPPSTTNTAIEEAQGQVLSYQTTATSSFAVVKVCEEDLVLPTTFTASGVGVTDGVVPMAGEEEEDKVELANALFGKSTAQPQQQPKKEGVIADGDLTGRTVTFSNGSKGMVVAHRHPIAFVLLDSSSSAAATSMQGDDNEMCTISTKLVTLNPTSIPSGSTVDYLGRHVSVLNDGSVSRSLPKAAAASGAEIDLTTGLGIGTPADGISLSINGDSSSSTNGSSGNNSERPVFVPIPKISDIGLIDSPLVTGITAIDALTPLGKGQNMLVIGQEEKENDVVGVNKRGWMMNLLRNVVQNHKGKSNNMRCFYGLTSGEDAVRSSVWNGMKDVGIQDDIVTVVSTRDSSAPAPAASDDTSSISTEKAMEAAEAVAIAATACTLGEHHALTTGGDAVVIIDDINLHKSLWDITTQHLVQVYGVDAVVEADLQGGSSSEMRGFFSGLIQRAARFNVKKGGGSVTLILLSTLPNPDEESGNSDDEPTFEASDFDSMSEKIKARIAMLVKAKVPLTPTNLRKIQIPVPKPSATEDAKRLALQHVEDLISMSDGQIWLDDALAKQGRSPPLDPSRSMTRVGVGADTRTCRADAPALRSVVGSLRFEFQQAMDVLDSRSSSSTLTPTSAVGNAKQVQRRDAFLLAMHQEPNEVRKLSQECIALLAASRGHLDGVLANGGLPGTVAGKESIDGLLNFVENETAEIVRSIDETLDLSLDERAVLEEAIEAYFAS